MNYDLIMQFGRMCRDSSLTELAGISSRYSLNWTGSGIVEDGELLTLSTSEWPSGDDEYSVCSLGAILEQQPAPKYSLSPVACRGILRRVARRGRALPLPLKAALTARAEQDGRE